MLKLKKKTIIIVASVLASLLLLTVLFLKGLELYIICEEEAGGAVSYYGERLMCFPELANSVISFDKLSDKYKKEITREEYESAETPEELLTLYSKPIFNQYDTREVGNFLSTEDYKKQPEGYFVVNDKWYFIEHEIDIKPDFFSSDYEIVRWYISIEEVDEPNGLVPYIEH